MTRSLEAFSKIEFPIEQSIVKFLDLLALEDSTTFLRKSNGLIIAKLSLVCKDVLHELDIRRHLFQCVSKWNINVKLVENFHKLVGFIVQLFLLQSLRIWDNRCIFS